MNNDCGSIDYFMDYYDDMQDYEEPEPEIYDECTFCDFRATCKKEEVYYCHKRDYKGYRD